MQTVDSPVYEVIRCDFQFPDPYSERTGSAGEGTDGPRDPLKDVGHLPHLGPGPGGKGMENLISTGLAEGLWLKCGENFAKRHTPCSVVHWGDFVFVKIRLSISP